MVDRWWVALAGAGALVLTSLAIRARGIYRQRTQYAAHWRATNEAGGAVGALHLVTLGDSLMQGIGASSPEHGLAGLAGRYLTQRSGRAVRITNLSRSGAKVSDVLTEQLPVAPIAAADVVLVSVSANDAMRQVPLPEYRADLDRLLESVPSDKTIVSDVPLVHRRRTYQPVMTEVAERHGVRRANVTGTFANAGNLRNLAGDFFHPNDRGYGLWLAAFQPELDALLRRSGLVAVVT